MSHTLYKTLSHQDTLPQYANLFGEGLHDIFLNIYHSYWNLLLHKYGILMRRTSTVAIWRIWNCCEKFNVLVCFFNRCEYCIKYNCCRSVLIILANFLWNLGFTRFFSILRIFPFLTIHFQISSRPATPHTHTKERERERERDFYCDSSKCFSVINKKKV